jgi:sulfopyruvate decarboxylase TPP-binding subunit
MNSKTRGGGPAAVSLDPLEMLTQIRRASVTHVVTVPDTHQRTLMDILETDDAPELITVCTEDEAVGVNLGLYLAGHRPMMLIQNSGLYAAMNTIRGLALDGNVPTPMLVGEFLRDPAAPPSKSPVRLVHLLEPTLQLWKIPFHRVDAPDDLPNIATAIDQAYDELGPVVMLVGATTAEVAA